jgi:AmmeMemoRadiSam system protein A
MEQAFSQEEGEDILKLVRYGLQASQRRLCMYPRIRPSERLKEHRGLFVGFYKGNELRGCIGSVNPGKPLEESVLEIALRSALKDERFEPLRLEEIPKLTLEVSIMTPPVLIDPLDIQLGVHGLMIIDGYQIGLFLPAVAVESGWDVKAFLEQTCLKGGMSKDAWRLGAQVGAFEVQTFRGLALESYTECNK